MSQEGDGETIKQGGIFSFLPEKIDTEDSSKEEAASIYFRSKEENGEFFKLEVKKQGKSLAFFSSLGDAGEETDRTQLSISEFAENLLRWTAKTRGVKLPSNVRVAACELERRKIPENTTELVGYDLEIDFPSLKQTPEGDYFFHKVIIKVGCAQGLEISTSIVRNGIIGEPLEGMRGTEALISSVLTTPNQLED